VKHHNVSQKCFTENKKSNCKKTKKNKIVLKRIKMANKQKNILDNVFILSKIKTIKKQKKEAVSRFFKNIFN
jgi:hypothetical protein